MEISVIDFIGHIGYALLFSGIVCLAYKKRIGWILRLIGEAIWIYNGFQLGLTSVWFWGILFVVWEAIGFYKWSRAPIV